MQIKLPLWASVVLTLGALLIYFLLLLGNKLDGLYPFFIYLISLGVSCLACGLTYGILPGKKAIEETKRVENFRHETEPGADSAHERAIGYWKWLAWCIAIPLAVTIGYHFQLAGYF